MSVPTPTTKEPVATPVPNPSVTPGETPKAERRRIPMSIPRQKLEVPELPGYNLHWALEHKVGQFLQGGYEFVDANELSVNQFNVATSRDVSGNADLGTRIRVFAGLNQFHQPEYHVLMKQRQEWFQEDQNTLRERNNSVLQTMFRGEQAAADGETAKDRGQRYVKTAEETRSPRIPLAGSDTALFNRPTRKKID